MVIVDNVRAIFMASNVTIMSHNKHIDIRHKYMNEYVEDRVMKIIFVKCAENDSNILTKNLSTVFHEKHSKKMIVAKLEKFPSLLKRFQVKERVLEMLFYHQMFNSRVFQDLMEVKKCLQVRRVSSVIWVIQLKLVLNKGGYFSKKNFSNYQW